MENLDWSLWVVCIINVILLMAAFEATIKEKSNVPSAQEVFFGIITFSSPFLLIDYLIG